MNEQQLSKIQLLLSHAPIAMAETDAAGQLRQANPKAVQLMMPLAAHLGLPLDNLLDTLWGYLPSVRQTVTQFDAEWGLIINQEPYRIEFSIGSSRIERYFSLTIEKISPESLLIFFDDVTDFLLKIDTVRLAK